jgi:hypothetical protein
MTAATREARRFGFTVIEILLVMVALALVMLLGGAVLLGGVRIEKSAAESLHRMSLRGLLAERFRADVSGAAAAPEAAGQFHANPQCLVLRMPEGGHVVYRWQEGELQRWELSGTKESRRQVSVETGCTGVEFSRGGHDRRVVTLRLSRAQNEGGPTRTLDISAALGGDLR